MQNIFLTWNRSCVIIYNEALRKEVLMHICYFDESGDDGFPNTSSDIFVLTSLSLHYSKWKDINKEISNFRKWLKKEYDFPVNFEFHTREFLLNKNPYKQLNINPQSRKEIIYCFFDFLRQLDVIIINSAVNKSLIKSPDYKVLKTALKDNVQSIDTYISGIGDRNKFLIITDEGRVGKMVNVTRQLQEKNGAPGDTTKILGTGIQKLIEDPLPKSSKESYFIQLSDMVAYIIYLYILKNVHIPQKPWSSRLLQVLNYGDEITLLDKIKNILNLKTAKSEEYGIIVNPT
jgi:hypothetical protein